MAGEPVAPLFLTFKYRLMPNKGQHAALAQMLEDQRQLYNAALEERIGSYRKTGRTRTYPDQCRALTEWRRSDTSASATPANLQRWTLRKLDLAFSAFLHRVKAKGRKAGFPRYRGAARWRSFGFKEFSGLQFDGKRLRFRTLPGGLRVKMHRPLPPGSVLGCSFTNDPKGWVVCFQVAVERGVARDGTRAVGLDLGLLHLATLSDGSTIPNLRPAKRAERELRRRRRALSRCKRGSKRRAKVRSQAARSASRVTRARSTYLHQVSADLVARFDLIAVEGLNIKGLAASNLAKSVNDAAWRRLCNSLAYKAERAGARVIEVNPRNTSRMCSGCGAIASKTLKERVHSCAGCGLVLDRDHNAALNILRLGVTAQGALNVADCGVRATGNLT